MYHIQSLDYKFSNSNELALCVSFGPEIQGNLRKAAMCCIMKHFHNSAFQRFQITQSRTRMLRQNGSGEEPLKCAGLSGSRATVEEAARFGGSSGGK